jgi:glyoxylase-like metal-dependent hydrolase (beta-lactamase superfamily II)
MATHVYEVYALRYAKSTGTKAQKYHRYSALGVADQPIGMDFYFWLVRNNDRTVLVDVGFDGEQTSLPAYRHHAHPIELLSRMGVAPEEVDHVVLTHAHFDHIGNVGLFPNATFTMARAEYDFWTGPLGDKPHLAIGVFPHEIAAVTRLLADKRLAFVDGEETILPGLTVCPHRGHTPGQLITEIDTVTGKVVLASDASHLYEEMERDWPFWLFVDLEGMYRTYSVLRNLAARADTTVVPGHDPAVMTRFATVTDDCVDLTAPVDRGIRR